jgi:hypothetical protein
MALLFPLACHSLPVDVLGRFDALARGPFPATMRIPIADGSAGQGRESSLTLVSRLRSSVTFPDQSPGTLFDTTLDGHAAVATRSSAGLDISVVTDDGVHVTTVRPDVPVVERIHKSTLTLAPTTGNRSHRQRRSPFYGADDDVAQADEPPVAMEQADLLAPLEIRIFLHDELRWTRARDIHADYVAWWLHNLESEVLPADLSINVIYLQTIAGISDQPYGAPSTITTWLRAVDRYVTSRGIRRTWKNKYVLLTQDRPAEGVLGQSIPASGIAIASLSGPYSVVAHEVGHLLGAAHSLAEWRAGWWPCRTNMHFNDSPFLANCYEYSAANVANIQRYIDLKGYLPPELGGPLPTPPALTPATRKTE